MNNPFEQDKPTPGPWKADNWPGYKTISGKGGVHVTDFVKPADARRILACVNACEGISTADLEKVAAHSDARVRLSKLSDVADGAMRIAFETTAQPNELPHDDRAEVLKGSSSA